LRVTLLCVALLRATRPWQLADMISGHHWSSHRITVSHRGTVFIKNTGRRLHLAPARAFLVRWVFALAIGNLLPPGLPMGWVIIGLVFWGGTTLQAMPRKNFTISASGIEVKDEMGRAVRIPQQVRRIVSLAPSVTETLFALGLGDRVVGDTDFCDYPPEAKQKTRIGGP